MKITIPVAGVELQGVTGQTVIYPKQLPVWPTRPMMIKIYPDKISGVGQTVTVAVDNQGTAVHTFELPYEDVIDFDMSFACPLMTRADRQKSTELTAESSLLFLCDTSAGAQFIVLGVFHCDLTYWHTIPGNQASLPEPPKIKMPGQDVDIYYPFATAPGVTFPVVAEPADDADPTEAIMPTTYTLGKTIDVRYIKKLTVKDVWGTGMDHVIEYENRNWNRANEDDALLCALRVRWNMQNGEWFWDAFKNFFWSNNFTYLRGLGGATEQAEVTVNMEYSPDKYAVYQQLMISSQIIMELNIPGINQYQYKVFRAEVVSDSGARWSGSTRTYRQQVRFRTTELQDNYISPVLPDSPAAIPVQFSASPLTMSSLPYYADVNAPLNVNGNVFWDIVPESDWLIINSPKNGRGKPGVSQAVTSRLANPSTTGRIGYMHIYRAGTTTKLATVNVSQNGAPVVNATPKFLPVSPEGELKSFTVSCATAGAGKLKVTNMSGASGAWVNLDASQLGQDGGDVYVNPALNLPESGCVPRSCIIRTTHNITGQFADVNVQQGLAAAGGYSTGFSWAGKGMYAYDGAAHNDNTFIYYSGFGSQNLTLESRAPWVTNLRFVKEGNTNKVVFNITKNAGSGADVDRLARIKVLRGDSIIGTLVIFQRAFNAPPANFVHASWASAEASDGSMHCFELITAASEAPTMNPPSQMYLHNIDNLTVNGVRLDKFRVMLDWCLFRRSLQIGMSVTGASRTISIVQYANEDAMAISTNTHWNRLAPVWVIGKGSLTFNVDVQAQKLNQRDEISFYRHNDWISLQSTEAHRGSPRVRRFTINIAANTTGAARGTEIRFQRPGVADIIIRIEQAG